MSYTEDELGNDLLPFVTKARPSTLSRRPWLSSVIHFANVSAD